LDAIVAGLDAPDGRLNRADARWAAVTVRLDRMACGSADAVTGAGVD
jgi:hypothetical protein